MDNVNSNIDNNCEEETRQRSVLEQIKYNHFDSTILLKDAEEFFKDYDFSKMISRNSDIFSDIHYAF